MKWHLYAALYAMSLMCVKGQKLTVLSEIADPIEKQAFLAAYEATDAGKRHALAQTFVQTYPRSWLLSQAYDVAARSSIDLGDYPGALNEAEFSLRLMPENPTLAVLVANLQARQGYFRKAESTAEDALDDLNRFVRPPVISEDSWRSLKPQLTASAYFALGRAYAGQAMKEKPSNRTLLERSLDLLNRSAAWNESDPETLYLRAIVELTLGKGMQAESDFAAVARSSSPLNTQALAQLQQLYQKNSANTGEAFNVFLSRVPKPQIDFALRESHAASSHSPAIRAGYSGSAACQACHPREYSTWRQTGMSRMLRAYKPENIMGNFSENPEFKDAAGHTSVRMGVDPRPFFDVEDTSGHWQRFHVNYTIGSKWQQAYATELPDGALQVLPIQYNSLQKAWINYWETIDAPGNKRTIIAEFPKLSSATNYQENCAVCHTSQLRAHSADSEPIDHASFREPGVNCEMCHGPSALHVDQMKKGHLPSKDALEPPVDFRRIDNREGVRICAQCHKQSAVRELGPEQEMNYSAGDKGYVPASWSQPFDVFSRRAFYKDGRFRQTTFIVEAFTRSQCYRNGQAQCASCHAPHLPNFSRNLTSLKFKDAPDGMCLQCHHHYEGKIQQHTHHASASEGSRCISCHMPKIMNALEFKARSHQIEIPRADLTERFGQDDSPNACLLCHEDRDASWARQRLDKW